jgi:hypothetical protein
MKRVLIAAVASSLVTGAVIAATGVAGSGDTKKKTSPPPTMAQALKDMEKQRDDHLARIAKRLDISADKLKNAMQKVDQDKLDAAVKAGRLTDAQRDAILACQDKPLTCDRSDLPALGGPGGFHRHGPGGPGGPGERGERGAKRNGDRPDDHLAALAKELGIDADKVEKAFRAERPKVMRRGMRTRGPGGPGGFGPPPGPPGPPGGPGGPEGGGPGAPGSFSAPAPAPGEPA